MTSEEKILDILQRRSIDFFGLLPCDRCKNLYEGILRSFNFVELNREEEGVGISAGALMAGARPAMLIQNSGLGNMVNALASLTRHYGLALPILMSWRGKFSETIAAQRWMGEYVPRVLGAMDIPYHKISSMEDIDQLDETLDGVFHNNEIRGYLLEPSVWKDSKFGMNTRPSVPDLRFFEPFDAPMPEPELSRFEMLKGVAGALEGKGVVCNIGVPCKELYEVCHQPSNFYMLGSMGMVTPIALGMALCSDKPIVSIDGDGSLLMNPSTLATIARTRPKNLVVLCIDNGVYGSTGNQRTATSECVDLGRVARGFGIEKIVRSADSNEITEALNKYKGEGPLFIHAICIPGNANVPNLTLKPDKIRLTVSEYLQS